jgi:RNA polymerase sigma-70 factor, ECF subfamily
MRALLTCKDYGAPVENLSKKVTCQGQLLGILSKHMDTTSASLLQRLRQQPAAGTWERFVSLYTPLLLHWARRLGLQDQDAADLVQDVFVVLVRKLPEFHYQPGRSFRGWLRTVLTNTWRDRAHRRAADALDSVATPQTPPADEAVEEREYQLYVVGQALKLMTNDFEPATWQACWETVMMDRPAADVAAELGVSVNAVYLAKSRVLSRLRQDLEGLLD